MPIELWFAFVGASAVLLIIPGPTILTVISYSMAHGRRANVPLVAAVALGDSTALVVSLLGLGALLATSAFWFTVVKWVGGLYLLYLGVKLLRAGISSTELAPPAAPGSRWRLFANTYLVTALNPKGIVFFVAFLPQFISPGAPVAATTLDPGHHVRRHGHPQRDPLCGIRSVRPQAVVVAGGAAAFQLRGRLVAVGSGCVGAPGKASRMKASDPSCRPHSKAGASAAGFDSEPISRRFGRLPAIARSASV